MTRTRKVASDHAKDAQLRMWQGDFDQKLRKHGNFVKARSHEGGTMHCWEFALSDDEIETHGDASGLTAERVALERKGETLLHLLRHS